jgi:hypothetical protein
MVFYNVARTILIACFTSFAVMFAHQLESSRAAANRKVEHLWSMGDVSKFSRPLFGC